MSEPPKDDSLICYQECEIYSDVYPKHCTPAGCKMKAKRRGMKFQITMKDPGGVYESLREAAVQSLPCNLDDDERDAVLDLRKEKLSEFARKWIEYGEYVTIEFDMEEGTARIVEKI